MNSRTVCLSFTLLALQACLTGCEKQAVAQDKVAVKPAPAAAKTEPGGMKRIELKDIEVKRLGIETAEVTKDGDKLSMPYSALIYDPKGAEWAFANPAPNVFVRTALKVEGIQGDKVVLAMGPAAGTRLVKSGAAELYGIEFGVGK